MHVVPAPPVRALPALAPLAPDLQGAAANEGNHRGRRCLSDLNAMVAGLVAKITARARARRVDVDLALSPATPVVDGDPADLAFAIAGIIGAQLRALDDGDGGVLRIRTRADGTRGSIEILGDEVPPLSLVRAAMAGDVGGQSDPTVRHCRRLLERQGGALELSGEPGRIGLRIVLPIVHRTHGVRLLGSRPEPVAADHSLVARAA